MTDPGIARLNALPDEDAHATLLRCCGSTRWVRAMLASRPFLSAEQLLAEADRHWDSTSAEDWREAMGHHPRIGERQLREKFAATAGWSNQEQRGVSNAGEDVLTALAEGNRAYEEKFGFIFLVCATGKSASEMLAMLRARLSNDRETELRVAAGEQRKITRIRLEKLLAEAEPETQTEQERAS